MQRKWYKSVLAKDIDAVNGLTGKKEGKTRLMNMVMQLRKGIFSMAWKIGLLIDPCTSLLPSISL
jgi:hypothetical protein